MPIETYWLESKGAIPGQDQLGIRAMAIRMYAHLVPGITNVTERARYFVYHPYAIHLWAKTEAREDPTAFKKFLRRFECILAIAERLRVHNTDEESFGVVGRKRLREWLRDEANPDDPDFRVDVDDLEAGYFGNSWGSFGQYYGGPEVDLRLVRWENGFPKLLPTGKALAEAFEPIGEACRLPQLLADTRPAIARFRAIQDQVAFDNLSPSEVQILNDIFLNSRGIYGPEGERRRDTCLLLLAIAAQSARPLEDIATAVYFASRYSQVGALQFECPTPLRQHLNCWCTYFVQENLAFAMEALLAAAVLCLQHLESNRDALPVDASSLAYKTVISHVHHSRNIAELASDNEGVREEDLRAQCARACKQADIAAILDCALKLLILLAGRIEPNAYGEFKASGMAPGSDRFGLDEFRALMHASYGRENTDLLMELITLSVNLHLRVATTKLAYNGDFTFKLLHEGGRLRTIMNVEPATSAPRLQQTAQMLSDIGLLHRFNKAYSITDAGRNALQQFGCA